MRMLVASKTERRNANNVIYFQICVIYAILDTYICIVYIFSNTSGKNKNSVGCEEAKFVLSINQREREILLLPVSMSVKLLKIHSHILHIRSVVE